LRAAEGGRKFKDLSTKFTKRHEEKESFTTKARRHQERESDKEEWEPPMNADERGERSKTKGERGPREAESYILIFRWKIGDTMRHHVPDFPKLSHADERERIGARRRGERGIMKV
jgi:hypothetical protein